MHDFLPAPAPQVRPAFLRRALPVVLSLLATGLFVGCTKTASTPAPTVTGFTPGSGPAFTVVTVTGSGYANGVNSVALGGVQVASSSGTVVSDVVLTFLVPANAVTGPVTVVTPSGSASSATSFIVAPSISTISVTTGSASQGTSVTVSGYGLAGITQIAFGTATATPTVQNANTITFPVPAAAPLGAVTITFTVNPSYGLPNLLSNFTVTA